MAGRDQLRRILEIDKRVRSGLYPHPNALASELEVARRVIFNDRAYMINTLGAPLEYSRERQGWFYTQVNWMLPSVLITRGELIAFLLAIESAQRQLGPAIESELTAAIEKIGRGLSGTIAIDLEALRRHFTFASLPAARAEPSTLLALHEAIEGQNIVAMEYFSAHRGQSSRRKIEPHHLHNSSGDWYVFAFDRTKTKMLTFNAARISQLQLENKTFVRQSDFVSSDFLRQGFRTEIGPVEYSVAIRFDALQASYIRERSWHPTQKLEELSGGGVLLRLQASGLGEIARWVLQYGPRAEVIAPPELRKIVASQLRDAAQMYEKEGKI